MVCDLLKSACTHSHRAHIWEVVLHAHAHVRPHIARVHACTHLRNSYLGIKYIMWWWIERIRCNFQKCIFPWKAFLQQFSNRKLKNESLCTYRVKDVSLLQRTEVRVDMVGTKHNEVLTQWRHMPMNKFRANIFLIWITSTYFWALEVFKNRRSKSWLFWLSEWNIWNIFVN